ncbi:hypothetical protein SRB5_46520 [Streptomyces sp. RB5]|uniref:Mycothiol-dependent maleylpyruvate isomerase metal-binding domain-containing protein n=1 Tax=Streptomyces smaragdinus TaxID=2585196 RepID=A0A7K0CLX5_9ACTN|nr:maleylpyruvate isomerase N-terminal domain-containing protein [Streptomyces smaragdinus]MQY14485.1 hypothetical protein [Streptomyces smaragdinus]
MITAHILNGFRDEAQALGPALTSLTDTDHARPSVCPPWTVRELIAHIVTATGRLDGMLAAPEPPTADTDAVAYFRPAIFTPEANARREAAAREEAAALTDPAGAFDAAWRRTLELAAAQPEGRRVATRHGDAMLLTEFMATRVNELVLHGLDLALSLGRPPWTTPSAARVAEALLLGEGADRVAEFGWDRPTLLAKVSGRTPLDPAEAARARDLGLTWLRLA